MGHNCYAVLIDGGFVKRKLGSKVKPAVAKDFGRLVDLIAMHPALSGQRLHRVYYYDAQPLEGAEQKPLGGPVEDFGRHPVAARSKALFDELARQPFFSLRMGETQFEGWDIAAKRLLRAKTHVLEVTHDDLRPRITQKGVDMRIGMDIAALTLKQHVQVIVLVTGDSDFVPAMKFARREGTQLFLCSLGQHVKAAMLEHSDLTLNLDGLGGVEPCEETRVEPVEAEAAATPVL